MKKVFTLLTLALMSIGSAWAETGVEMSENTGTKDQTLVGTCYSIDGTYIAGAGGSKLLPNKGVKLRTNKTDNTLIFTVAEGYTITGFKLVAHSNDAGGDKKDADNNIIAAGLSGEIFATSLTIDGGENLLDEEVAFTYNAASEIEISGFESKQSIAITFNNDQVVKNNQLQAYYELTWYKADPDQGDAIIPFGTFESSEINIKPGESVTAPALTIVDVDKNDISEYYEIDYASSNEKIATVNEDGEVTIIDGVEGSVEIVAFLTSKDEDNYADGVAKYTITVASELEYPYTWDFTTFEESGTWDMLTEDTENWEVQKNSYQNKVTVSGTVTAGGIVIPETNHIVFSSFSAKKLYINKGSLQLNGKDLTIALPNVPAGASIALDFENPSGDESRGLTLTNVNEDADNILEPSTREVRLFTAAADGDVTLTSTSGVRIYGICVTFGSFATELIVPTNGYATFSSRAACDFSASGAEVYTAVVDGSTAVLTLIEDGIVPANTGVIIKSDEAVDALVLHSAPALEIENDLVAAVKDVKTEGIYILVPDGESVKFTKMTGGTLSAGKAYLPAASEVREIFIVENEATGISEVKAAQNDGEIYNLSGLRITAPTKGLYIQNGRKMIVK